MIMNEFDVLQANKVFSEYMTNDSEVSKDLQEDDACMCMHFHDDFQWQIPVIIKITQESITHPTGLSLQSKVEDVLRAGSKGEMFLACLNFINWYNETKNNTIA